MPCEAQSLENAGKRGVQVEKGTDKTKCGDKIPGQRAVKQGVAGPFSQKYKRAHTAKSHKGTIFYGAQSGFSDHFHVSQGIIFRDNGQQKHCHGTGQGIGEENKGHCHSCEHAVDA